MTATIFNSAAYNPLPHSQPIRIPRLPDTRKSSAFFTAPSSRARTVSIETPILTAHIADNPSSQTWTITTSNKNVSSHPQPLSVKLYAWPMFAPEQSQFLASASTSRTIQPNHRGQIEIEVQMRDLAEYKERMGKWVLEAGVYMFEIKGTDDLSAGMGILKQVFVPEGIVWDD